jgi:uncharacterized membrane protein YgaE (UPF0421/DUF939 family)
MDAWSRKQYAEAETKLDEAVSTLDEMRHEESKAFDNRPIGWQRSQVGEAEQARLHRMDNLIRELHDAREEIGAMQPDEPAPLSQHATLARSYGVGESTISRLNA